MKKIIIFLILFIMFFNIFSFPQHYGRRDRGRRWKKNLIKRIKQMDINHDGKISQDEWSGPIRIFYRLDKNNDNYLTPDELPFNNKKNNDYNNKNSLYKKYIQRIRRRIKRMDKNHDGKISREEWTGSKRMFSILDKNHDNFLTKDELFCNDKNYFQQKYMQRIRRRIRRMDKNHDGKISREEWTGSKRMFSILDKNHDNFLTKDELFYNEKNYKYFKKKYMQRIIRKIRKMDKNHDGKISQDEWTKDQELFLLLDINKDGYLTKDEIQQFLLEKRKKRNRCKTGKCDIFKYRQKNNEEEDNY